MWEFFKRLRKRPPRKVGLALSGGGARGLAHIGVIKVLERENVPIDLLAGTSMGGIIAALYATGLSAHEMEEAARRISSPRQLLTLVDRTLPRRGLLQGRKVVEYLAQWLGEVTFDQLKIPLALVAADLNGCQKVILQEGSVLDAVRATIALPGLLAPLEREGQLLVDGGLMDNLPVDIVRQMGADVVIAVDIATDQDAVILFAEELHRHPLVPNGLVDTLEVLWRSVDYLTREVNRRVLEECPPDLLIHPVIPAGVTAITGFTRADETIAAGEKAAIDALPKIQALLGSSTP
jgi:NTE family protein